MNETLEKFWDEFYCSECALIDTNEERELTKKQVCYTRPSTPF